MSTGSRLVVVGIPGPVFLNETLYISPAIAAFFGSTSNMVCSFCSRRSVSLRKHAYAVYRKFLVAKIKIFTENKIDFFFFHFLLKT